MGYSWRELLLFHRLFFRTVGGVIGYNNALMLGSFSTGDNSLSCGSHIYHQKDFAASINSSTLVCFHLRCFPNSTLNAGVGYLLWFHRHPSTEGLNVSILTIYHLPFYTCIVKWFRSKDSTKLFDNKNSLVYCDLCCNIP